MAKEILGSIYTGVSDDFQGGMLSISRCIKAEKHDLGVVEMKERKLGNIYGFDGGNYAGNVYDGMALSPTIRTYQGGNQQPMIIAMRGRNPDNPSDRISGTNTLTSVQKDNMVLEKVIERQYRIRKLTPLESWRLMGFSDEDFQKAEKVSSNTQLYKQAGNSIVRDVIMAVLSQLL